MSLLKASALSLFSDLTFLMVSSSIPMYGTPGLLTPYFDWTHLELIELSGCSSSCLPSPVTSLFLTFMLLPQKLQQWGSVCSRLLTFQENFIIFCSKQACSLTVQINVHFSGSLLTAT